MPRAALWTSIADTIRREIAEGLYAPGDKLPTEAGMASRFGVNRHTVRRACAALAAEKLLHPRRGAGVFVAQRVTDYPLGRRVRFHRNVAATGQIPSRRITRLETRRGSARETEALRIGPGDPVHLFEGVSLADDVPLAAFRSVFSADRVPGLLAALRDTASITEALAACGTRDHIRIETRLTAKLAAPLLAVALRIATGAPVLRTVSINVDGDGVPVEYGTTWFAGDRVTLTVTPD